MDRQEKGIKKINKSSTDSSFIMKPKKKISKKWLILPAVLILCTAFYLYVRHDNSLISVRKITVTADDIPESFDGFRILVISDMYGKMYGSDNKRLTDAVNSAEFDIIVMTGDYIDESSDTDGLEGVRLLLENIDNREAPVYFVLGDNDACLSPEELEMKTEKWFMTVDPGENNPVQSYLENLGAKFIYPICMIEKGEDRIFLTGLTYYEKIFDTYGFDSDKDFSIAVTHKPVNYDVNKRLSSVNRNSFNEVDYDLIISGSTLGGVVRLPVLGTVYTKEYGMLPQEEYIYGLHTAQDRYSYITSGLGTPKGKFRLFNTPEIAVIELKRGSQADGQ